MRGPLVGRSLCGLKWHRQILLTLVVQFAGVSAFDTFRCIARAFPFKGPTLELLSSEFRHIGHVLIGIGSFFFVSGRASPLRTPPEPGPGNPGELGNGLVGAPDAALLWELATGQDREED